MQLIITILIQLPPILLAITIHEYSHGLAAYLLGDDTAKRAGRLTLNPIPHIDPIGALMLFIARIGWAKPVPINPYNFKNFKRDVALSAAAGPGSNFIMASVFAIVFRIYTALFFTEILTQNLPVLIIYVLIRNFILFNLALGIFNLIPIPPMDGSKILGGFLPDRAYIRYTMMEKQGVLILMIVFAASFMFNLNIIGNIIMPPLNFFFRILTGTNF